MSTLRYLKYQFVQWFIRKNIDYISDNISVFVNNDNDKFIQLTIELFTSKITTAVLHKKNI